jgi:hypothetical protein
MGAVSDDRGPEEIPVLMEFEVQHWEKGPRRTGRNGGWKPPPGNNCDGKARR